MEASLDILNWRGHAYQIALLLLRGEPLMSLSLFLASKCFRMHQFLGSAQSETDLQPAAREQRLNCANLGLEHRPCKRKVGRIRII